MADRPAKRQRRSTIVHSDDEDDVGTAGLPLRNPKARGQLELDHGEDATLSLSPTRTRQNAVKSASKKSSGRSSPKTTPEKSRKPARKPKEPEKTKAINTFFGKATEEQRWHRKSKTPEEVISDGEFEDAIEDDDFSDSVLSGWGERNNAISILDKRKTSLQNSAVGSEKTNKTLPPSTQRFVKPLMSSKGTSETSDDKQSGDRELHRPWADKYGPVSLDELAIHKKKAADVQKWFENVLAGHDHHRLLILKGPAGSGKTITVSLLSKTLGFSTSFWQNPTYYDPSSSGSIASQFNDFLHRGAHFGTLLMGDEMSQPASQPASDRHVLVVEEFPAGMARSSGVDSFRSVILQFLARSIPRTAAPFRSQQYIPPTPPVVMIISETLLSSSTTFSESFTAHRLLGPDILNHPLTTVIEFNPVAPTFVSKALDLVMRKEARDSQRRRVPGPAVLQKLAEMGDVRNAISSLEFLCVRTDSNADWSGTVAAKPKKASKGSLSLTDMEKSSLQLISQRETTLDMFHAAGKIVYNKREDPRISDPSSEIPPKPPDHLIHLHTSKISQVDIEALLNETGTDIQTFISTLHENHVLSCNGDSFIDSFEGCSEILSVSDVLNPESRRSLRSRASNNASIVQSHLQGGSFDALRQDEISFNVATRGLLFHLPYPVHRAAPSSGRKGDAFKMFYPTSLRLWKPMEEIEAVISIFVHDEILDSGGGVKIKTEPGTEGVASWKVRQNLAPVDVSAEEDEDEPPRKAIPSRDSFVLEILPYLAKVKHAKGENTKALTKITHFTGASVQMTGDEPDEDDPDDEAIVGAKKVSAGSRFAPTTPARRKDFNFGSPMKKAAKKEQQGHDHVNMEHLYLEDDDIEDD